MHRESEGQSVGPLRNGNPRGNPNLAPRCGARTRAGCPCQAPAMRNGRCRMHGGAATGARTADGIARIRAATTTHGFYSAEGVADRRCTDAFIAKGHALMAAVRVDVPKEERVQRRCRKAMMRIHADVSAWLTDRGTTRAICVNLCHRLV